MRNISKASLLLTTCTLGALFAACSSEDPATDPTTNGSPSTTSPGTTTGTVTSGTTSTSGGASTTVTSSGATTSGGTTGGTASSTTATVSSSSSGSTTSSAGSTGSAASTTGGGGGCGELAGPIERSGDYVLEFGDIYFAVEAAGAKVIEFKRAGGANVLTTDAVDATNFGSTLWTAPQAGWNDWPPVPEVDSEPYTVTVDETAGSITAVSMGTPSVGPNVTVTKVFTANLCDETIDISYSIANSGTAAASFSVWEVTRVGAGGLSFWGAEEGYLVEKEEPEQRLTAEFETDTYWFDYATDTTMEGKLFTEGVGGYLAFTDGTDLFVKAFSDVPASAHPPDHGEIEVYSNRTGGYVELEIVGGYGSIAAGASATLETRWYLRPMPEGATRAVGDAALKAAVLDLIAP